MISSFCARQHFFVCIFSGVCVLCYSNLLEIAADGSHPEHTPVPIYLLPSTSLSSDTRL